MNYQDAQKTHDRVTCEEVDGNGKDGVDYELSFIHHILPLEIKAGNKYDKILTVANSGGRVKIELLCCSLEMSQSFHFLKRQVKNGER